MPNHSIQLKEINTTQQEDILTEQLSLFNLLQLRDSEFTLNEAVILEYPAPLEDFLLNPVTYLNDQLKNKYNRQLIDLKEIVILTTYGEKLINKLTNDGFSSNPINMPAGPENTYHFSKTINPHGNYIYYIEAVNEADEKIKPTFIITAKDEMNNIIGGISGNIFEKDKQKFAYIATTVTAANSGSGLGSKLMQETLAYLQKSGVSKVNVGTQTADKFYIKHGFKIAHHLIQNIRYRMDSNGNKIQHELVILEKTLTI